VLFCGPQRLAGQGGLIGEGSVARVEGHVSSSQDGHAISDARVRLETSEGDLVREETSSSSGRFDIPNLRRIVYRLTVTAEGYRPYQEPLDLTRSAERTMVSVLLSPAEKEAAAPPLSRTDAAAPKSARKEYQKGVRAVAQNKLDEAEAHFQKAVVDYPCYARAQTLLALALIRHRSTTEAEAAFRKAIQCDPDFLKAYLDLGELLNLEKRYRESSPVLQEGLRRAPGAWKFYYQLGIADSGLGQWAKAEQDYLKTLSLNPSPPADTYVKLADVYSRENAYNKAYAEMAEYLRLEPQGRFAPRIREIMRQMQASGAVHQPPAAISPSPPNF
jgi:tetratricopeptide (TPR) repeat protein